MTTEVAYMQPILPFNLLEDYIYPLYGIDRTFPANQYRRVYAYRTDMLVAVTDMLL